MNTGRYVCREFEDIDEMVNSFSSHWNLEFSRFESYKSSSLLQQFTFDNIQISNAVFSGKSLLRGGTPEWRTFAFHRGKESDFIWRKIQINHDNLMIFPDRSEIEVAHKGRTNNPLSISISDSLISSVLSSSELEKYTNTVTEHEVIRLNNLVLKKLANILDSCILKCIKKPSLLDSQLFQNQLEGEIVRALVPHLITFCSTATINNRKKVNDQWEKIDKVLSNDPKSLIRVNELSETTGINQRTMVRLFHRRYGLTPKSYLRIMRLNKTKFALSKASPNHTTVAEIASQYGFFHTGQFAKDYNLLFDELPSMTLNIVK